LSLGATRTCLGVKLANARDDMQSTGKLRLPSITSSTLPAISHTGVQGSTGSARVSGVILVTTAMQHYPCKTHGVRSRKIPRKSKPGNPSAVRMPASTWPKHQPHWIAHTDAANLRMSLGFIPCLRGRMRPRS